jgi:hypothetical protein
MARIDNPFCVIKEKGIGIDGSRIGVWSGEGMN